MAEEKKPSGLSRRDFLKDAGLIVGGATVGTMTFLNACKGSNAAATVTTTVTPPPVTTTVSGAVTSYVDPIDGTSYPTVTALKAHFNAVHPNADTTLVAFNVNGTGYAFQVKPYWSLSEVLRDGLNLFAVKNGCMMGECGACTVLLDGVPIFSCLILAMDMEGRSVITLEGLSSGGALSPVQQRFYDTEAFQCGICTPGFIMAAQGLLSTNAKPTLADVQLALSGHVCFCGNVNRTVNALVGGL